MVLTLASKYNPLEGDLMHSSPAEQEECVEELGN